MKLTQSATFVASVFALALALSVDAAAEEKKTKPVGSGPNPYSECGIGAAIFKDTAWAAATSNVTWDLGTTAIISATASPETCSAKKVAAATFIINTYARLTEQTATGRGEHLTTALDLFGCSAPQHAAAIQQVRDGMKHRVGQPGYLEQPLANRAADLYQLFDGAARTGCVS
jgi:hypothetical protein